MARGRPVGWRKENGVRSIRTMKAYDDEWEIIRRLAKIIKHGDKEKIIKFLDEIEQDSTRVEWRF